MPVEAAPTSIGLNTDSEASSNTDSDLYEEINNITTGVFGKWKKQMGHRSLMVVMER